MMPMSESLPRPKISVLLPAFNEEALIGDVIDTVHNSFRTVGLDSYEIIVCDNNSTDATAGRATDKGAKVVYEPHNQISRARNKAAASSTGEWLIFIDADTLISPELLGATINCFGSGKICGGGSLVRFNTTKLGVVANGMLEFWNRISRLCNLAAGSYIFCYRAAWAKTGGFDETIYAGEELRFSRKIRRWGKKKGMRFTVLTDAPVLTSARKVEWYGGWQLIWTLVKLAVPGALKKRERCAVWYERPGAKSAG